LPNNILRTGNNVGNAAHPGYSFRVLRTIAPYMSNAGTRNAKVVFGLPYKIFANHCIGTLGERARVVTIEDGTPAIWMVIFFNFTHECQLNIVGVCNELGSSLTFLVFFHGYLLSSGTHSYDL